MKSTKIANGDNSDAAQVNNLIDDAKGGSFLLVHAQTSPGLTLKVEAGVCYVGSTRVIYAGGNTPSFSAPGANPRIDVVTIDSSGTIAITQGAEAGSPSAPAYPTGKIVLAEVYNRVGESALYDTDQGSNGYIYNDVRPVIASTPVSVNATTGASDAAKLVQTDSSGLIDSSFLSRLVKFGGTGADGALSISSGTTTLSFGSANVLVKNYSSVSITGTAALAFSNSASDGSVFVMKSQGNVTITSSATRAIDLRLMGAAGGTAGGSTGFQASGNSGNNGFGAPSRPKAGLGGLFGTTTAQTTPGGQFVGRGNMASPFLNGKLAPVFAGAGGGAGGQGSGSTCLGGTGGTGGGGIYIECGGALNITGTIDVSGANGGNASGPGSGGGGTSGGAGGGGGKDDGALGGTAGSTSVGAAGGAGAGGGSVVIVYATLTANTGTYTVSGGSAGSSVGSAGGSGNGGNGMSMVVQNTEFI